MFKSTTVIVLFTLTIFWSPASARSVQSFAQNDVIDSDSYDTFNFDILSSPEKLQEFLARAFIIAAPEAHASNLEDKYEELLAKNYEDTDEFIEELDRIFEEETGLDADEEIKDDKEKLTEIVRKLKQYYEDKQLTQDE